MHTAFLVLAILAIAFQSLILILAFFGPDLPYRIEKPLEADLDSDYFLSTIAVLTDAQVHKNTPVEVLTNGECFYEAELNAIRSAERTINLEAYIFILERSVSASRKRSRSGRVPESE